YPETRATHSSDLDRDLGIALTQWPGVQQQRALAEQALPLLESSLKDWPNDVAGLEAKGLALRLADRPREALQVFQACLSHAPEDEFALLSAAETAAQLGQLDAANAYFRHTIALNPWIPAYHLEYARVLMQCHEWSKACAECKTGLRLDPMRLDLRQIQIECLLRQGDNVQARKEFADLLRFQPSEEAAWRRWFLQRLQ
ncbi:MAG TPA: hypothetical protein VG099_24600, partial [Gemmataceae bacterium]|nr:hypothetical protein [Gemmataceae bacterium]